jgi:hypothetical protein
MWFIEGCNLGWKRRLSRQCWSLCSLDDSDNDESKFEVKRPAANSLYVIILRTSPQLSTELQFTCEIRLWCHIYCYWHYGIMRWPMYSIKLYTVREQTSIPMLSKFERNALHYPCLRIQRTRINLICTFCRHLSQQYKQWNYFMVTR